MQFATQKEFADMKKSELGTLYKAEGIVICCRCLSCCI